MRNPRTWAVLLGIVVIVVVVVLATGGGDDEEGGGVTDIQRSPDTAIEIPFGEPIIIGMSTALTGPVGARGTEYRDAVIVSVERWKEANGPQIGGHDIQVVAEDDGCTEPEITAEAARRLLGRQGLVGVIGPQCSSGVATVASLYRDAGIVAISGSATTTSLTTGQPDDGFFFRTAFRNDLEGTLIGSSAAIFGVESAYLVDNGELEGIDLATSAGRFWALNGVSVARASIVQGAVDFSELAARIAEANPSFVAFFGFNPEAALLYRQLRDAGYDGLFGAGDGAASQTNFVEPVGDAAEGVLFAGCRFPLPADFLADFLDVHGQEPSATFAAQYADAATVLLDAVREVAEEGEEAGSLVIEPKALRDAVRATSIEGISGPIAFDAKGDRVPRPGDDLSQVQEQIQQTGIVDLEDFDSTIYVNLGLIPCQVQDGELVNLFGPGTPEIPPIRFP
ncbi:MAG: branched-chain amino acid ABC transporter substrate-binding protein [Thermoanaerobaculia bacterium]